MFGRLQIPRDPFEGKGARRTHLRLQVEGFIGAHPPSEDAAVFRTSGTTGGARGEHALSTTATYDQYDQLFQQSVEMYSNVIGTDNPDVSG